MVDEAIVYPDKSGKVMVNLSAPKHYYKGLKRLDDLLTGRFSKNFINKDDVVLILPNMFTGGADFHLTEFGYIPGGLIVASAINSVLTGEWLYKMDAKWLPLFACFFGGILGLFSSTLAFWICSIVIFVLFVCLGVLFFSYLGVAIPWLYSAMGFLGTGVMVFAERSRYSEVQASMLELVEAQKKYLEKEISDAAEMAVAYRPDEIPDWAEMRIQEFHESFDSASGDWYAFASAKDRKLYHFVMCDITGHGVQAALVVSACKTILSQIRIAESHLFEKDDFLVHYTTSLNRILFDQGQGRHNTTLGGITFDLENNQILLMTCGHPWPLYRQLQRF